jgi:type I restriction enzyme M protein
VAANEVAREDAPSRATWVVETGGVITSAVRPIRRPSSVIDRDQDGFVCPSGLAVLRPKGIPPETLLAYLRLPTEAEILSLHTTASMYPVIPTRDLLMIPFLSPSATPGPMIVDKIKGSRAARAARQESHRLLDEAKTHRRNRHY